MASHWAAELSICDTLSLDDKLQFFNINTSARKEGKGINAEYLELFKT